MKMVKSLLLGSAAGLVAVAGAQAADLPVKAKPVEYVKICTLYGDGFYYIPGTDTCLKVGGYVRADYGINVETNVVQYSGDQGAQDRSLARNAYTTRHRLNIQLDARTQTAYGTLRTFESVHVENRATDNLTNQVDVTAQRAFIQWAGFTIGHTASFTDNAGSLGDSGMRSLFQSHVESTQGANGINQIAYTWELGNGMTLSVGADEQRGRNIFNLSDGTARVGGAPTNTRSGEEHPNPWIALQINQAWGRATAAFVAQEARATYYTGTPGVVGSGCPAGAQPGTSQCFYPDDKWGWAAKVGLELKTPWIAPGDRLGLTANYSVGFVRYALSNTNNPGLFGSGNQTTLGFVTDAVYSNGTQMELTTAWSATAAYEHYWTPQFSTTVYGGYGKVEYNDTVVADGRFCKPGQIILLSGQACDPSFSLFQVGSHTDWFPASGFRLAVDVMFTGINTAMEGQARLGQVRGLRPTGVYTIKDEGIWAGMFRAQRSFPAGGD